MRPQTAITLAVLCALGISFSAPVFAQQARGPRQIISEVVPRYPDLARPMRLEGAVKVTVTVAPSGSVKSVKAVGGHPLLLKAAEDAIQKWKWAPAPEDSQELIELRFRPD